jgi:hypothetical protein
VYPLLFGFEVCKSIPQIFAVNNEILDRKEKFSYHIHEGASSGRPRARGLFHIEEVPVNGKEFKTYEEQVSILESRGLLISDPAEAQRILSKVNYYKLINGYKTLFINDKVSTDEQYRLPATFVELYSLYIFDEELRFIFLKEFLAIENHLKSAGPCPALFAI